MQNITRDEAIALENKMLKAYFIIRYIGLGLWIVGLMISADIEILRCKHISERTDKELKEKWAELEAEEKK